MGNGEWKERMNEFGARTGRQLNTGGEVRLYPQLVVGHVHVYALCGTLVTVGEGRTRHDLAGKRR